MDKSIILTGVRANADFTIGNYLGAILPMVKLQKKFSREHQINIFVPDLHSFTTPIKHKDLYLQIIRSLKYYIASGIDLTDDNVYIYRQSYIAAHSELTVILNNFTYFGELSRMTQFKEKKDNDDNVSAGLFDYPVLMASDILLYGARWVPVGEDQRQHLELARDIAIRVNNRFNSEIFIVPEEWSKQQQFIGRSDGIRIRSLTNPNKKMSKSDTDPNGSILLSDDPAVATKKILAATTDSNGEIKFDMDNNPGVSNLIHILSLLIDEPIETTIKNWNGKTNYLELKQAVADEVKIFLQNLRKNISNMDESELMRKLESSEYLMRDVAIQRLYKIQQAVGLRP